MIPTTVRALESSLEAFELELPSPIAFSERNLHLRASSKWLPRYIMIHIWWHQCYCDLHRVFLTNLRESMLQSALDQLDAQFVLECQTKCFHHASAIAKIFSLVEDLESSALNLEIEIAQCAYQTGRILLHRLSECSEIYFPPPSCVIEQVNNCILMVKRLSSLYPTVSSIVS